MKVGELNNLSGTWRFVPWEKDNDEVFLQQTDTVLVWSTHSDTLSCMIGARSACENAWRACMHQPAYISDAVCSEGAGKDGAQFELHSPDLEGCVGGGRFATCYGTFVFWKFSASRLRLLLDKRFTNTFSSPFKNINEHHNDFYIR